MTSTRHLKRRREDDKRVVTGVVDSAAYPLYDGLDCPPAAFPPDVFFVIADIRDRRASHRSAIEKLERDLKISPGDRLIKTALKAAKAEAVSDNMTMRALYERFLASLGLFRDCPTCQVPHYFRNDFDCAKHVDWAPSQTNCTTCGVKHRYPHVDNTRNSMDRRCADNVFFPHDTFDADGRPMKEGQVCGVFCTTCKFTVWQVPDAPFSCVTCGRVVMFSPSTQRFVLAMPKMQHAGDAGLSPMDDGSYEGPPAKRARRDGGFPPHDSMDAGPAPRGAWPPPGAGQAEAYRALAAEPEAVLSEEAPAFATSSLPPHDGPPVTLGTFTIDILSDLHRRKMETYGIVDPLASEPLHAQETLQREIDEWRMLLGMGEPDAPLFGQAPAAAPMRVRGGGFRGGDGYRGVRGGGRAEDPIIMSAFEYCEEAKQLHALQDVIEEQIDTLGSAEDDVEKDYHERRARCRLFVVDNGFAGVTARVLKKESRATIWTRQQGDQVLDFVRGEDWLGLELSNAAGNKPILAHVKDKHNLEDTLELGGKAFASVSPNETVFNKTDDICEANLRWVYENHPVTNYIGVFWRYEDDEDVHWMTLPYRVVPDE